MMSTEEALDIAPGASLAAADLALLLPTATPGALSGVVGVLDQYADHPVSLSADQVGGVHVVVRDVNPGPAYLDEKTWFGFHVNAAYPNSDVYPHFVGPLHRRDLSAHGEGFSVCQWQGREAVQLSRRSNRWDPTIDTAALKAMKVMAWLASR
jgi:hypothetical protein